MIADIRFWEQKASEGHYAIPHFNVWNAEMLMGVSAAWAMPVPTAAPPVM